METGADDFVERVGLCLRGVHRSPRGDTDSHQQAMAALVAVLSEAGSAALFDVDVDALKSLMVMDPEASAVLAKAIRRMREARRLGLEHYRLVWNATALDHLPGRRPTPGVWRLE